MLGLRRKDLMRDIRRRKSPDEVIEKVENLEKFVMGAWDYPWLYADAMSSWTKGTSTVRLTVRI